MNYMFFNIYIYFYIVLAMCSKERSPPGDFTFIENYAGSIGLLSCQLPFILVGNPQYICSTSGIWEGDGVCGKFPFCVLSDFGAT